MNTNYIDQIPEMAPFLANANHIDIKTAEGELTLREFIANMFSYQPPWITFLYHVRKYFVRLLGMRQEGVPQAQHMAPHDVTMLPGQKATFFEVKAAAEERLWIAAASESHLTAHLGVVVEPLAGSRKRFHVLTIVHYHRWTGPVYFNVIRPFHHLVVGQMVKAGVGQSASILAN
ncbi:MAG: DUF2867 domain-containing protein [Anaerolineales bacterium]|nr:DUF2867 domain-containing protein [Anaerolineales bacterium]